MVKKNTTFEQEIDGARPMPMWLEIKMWLAIVLCVVIWGLAILHSIGNLDSLNVIW